MSVLHALPAPSVRLASALTLLGLSMVPVTRADTGPYVGAGIGVTSLNGDVEAFDLDNEDFGFKGFIGFNIDIPFLDFAVEGGYTDLGTVSTAFASPGGGGEAGFDARGWNAFGVVAADVGPFAVFGKLGLIRWDLDAFARFSGEEPVDAPGGLEGFISDTGTDIAAGVGARVAIGPVQVRGEAEYFRVGAVDNAFFLSTSLVWQF